MAIDAGVKATILLFLLVALPVVSSITITTHDKPHEDSALPPNGNSSTIDDEISTLKPTINKQEPPLQSSLILTNADNRRASTKLNDENDKEESKNRRESKMANPDYKRRRNDRQRMITSGEENATLLDQKSVETQKETTIKTNDVNNTDEDLVLQERQRRLIPYQTYYKLQQSNPSLLQHNSIQSAQTYRTVPYEVVKQNAVFTPFTDSNKLPGGFTPMTKNSLIDQQYRQLIQLTSNNGQTGNNNYNTILVQKLVQPTAVPYIKQYDDVRLANQNYGKLPQNVQFVQKFVQPSQVKPQYVNYYARPVAYSRRPTQNNYVPVKSYEDLQAVLMNHRIKPIVVDVHMVKPKYRPAQISVYDSRYSRPNLVLDGGVRPVFKPNENTIPQYKPEPAVYKQVPVLVNKPNENTVLQYKPEPKPVNVPTALLNYAYKIASPQLSNNGPVQFDYKPIKGSADDDKSFEQIQAPLIKQSHEIIYPQQIKQYQTYAINKPSSLPQVQTTYSTPSVLDQQKTYVATISSDQQKPYAVLSPVQQQALLPLKNANSLTYLLKTLQKSNTLPQTFTPDNIDSSIKTLVNILNALKYHQKEQHQPVVYRPPNEEHENEAGVGLGGHIVVPDDDDSNEGGEEEDDGTVSERFPANTPEGGTPGKPGVDYPALSFIPETAFSCKTQRYKGFFGDPETNCQVWHYCDLNGGQASFLCPNGTIFSQVALTCDWWYNVKCASTPQLYVLNERLYKYILPFSPKFPEDYSGPLVDRYLTMKFKEMEEKMAREKKGKGTTEATTDKSNEDDEEEEEGDIDDNSSVQITTSNSSRGK